MPTELRLHEIAESEQRILNPITPDKLNLVGEACRPMAGQRMLDLACGKGEMLCQFARQHGIVGLGVDISSVFLDAARARASEFGVADRVDFAQGDAGEVPVDSVGFDLVSCIGATWIGGGLTGTLELMKPALSGPDGLLLVGEPYWIDEPPEQAYTALGIERDEYTSLAGTNHRFANADCELIEMVLADGDSWDRYAAAQWRTLSDWIRAHPDDPDVGALRAFLSESRRGHLEYVRRYLGWGIFVLRTG
jgi:SAM-dependent methyltransferase